MTKFFSILSSILIIAMLASCSNHHDHSDKMIFRYNEVAGISTLDPAFAKDQALIWATSQLYNGLVRLDEKLEVQPSIAHSWDISADGLTYTFHLRRDVLFHRSPLFHSPDSTRAVTASDFVYSLNRILDPTVASPGRWIFNEVAPDGFSAPDDSTFVVRLLHPFAPFLSLLAMPYCSVVPREVVQHYGPDFRQHPVGTGPFCLQMWKEGVKLIMRRNPHYFEHDSLGRPLPYLDAVAVTFIVDKQTVFLEFVKGNLDFMNSLDATYKDELLTRTGQLKAKYQNRIVMESLPFLNTEYLGFLVDGPDSPLLDPRIRKAINYGFDREKMMRYLRNGIGTPGTAGFIPIGLPGSDTSASYGYHYNPQLSAQLLAEAGYPEGRGLPDITLTTTSSYLDLCRFIQQQLSLLHINVKIDLTPPAALREQIAQGKSPWFRGSWIADYPDAENYLSLFYSPNRAPDGPNYTHFNDPLFNKLYREAQYQTSPQLRSNIYRQMDSIVMSQAPVVVLYYDQILHFTHPNVQGIRSNAMNALDLRFVTISH